MKKIIVLLLLVIMILSVTGCKSNVKEITTEDIVEQLMDNSWLIMSIYNLGTEMMLSSRNQSCEVDGVTYYKGSSGPLEYYSAWETLVRETYSPSIADYILETDDIIVYEDFLYVKGGNKIPKAFPTHMFNYSIDSVTEDEIRVKLSYTIINNSIKSESNNNDKYIDKEDITVIKKIDDKWLIAEEQYSEIGIN